jgi:AcrR family transcriptional regulator
MQATSRVMVSEPPKRLRADAQRNYDKIVAVAREVFADKGADAALDEIAKRAGVGPGTLYRHFPKRADLLLAVLQDWIGEVQAEGERVATLDPDRALDEWFRKYLGYKNFWRGLHLLLLETPDDVQERTALTVCKGVLTAISTDVIERAKAAGLIRREIEPITVMQMVSGIAFLIDQSSIAVDVEAHLAIIRAGIRPTD